MGTGDLRALNDLEKQDERALALYKDELCTTALRIYQYGADSISTFKWYSHVRTAELPSLGPDTRS